MKKGDVVHSDYYHVGYIKGYSGTFFMVNTLTSGVYYMHREELELIAKLEQFQTLEDRDNFVRICNAI